MILTKNLIFQPAEIDLLWQANTFTPPLYSGRALKSSKASVFNFAIFAFIGTIFFDLVTGILFAPLFGQTFFNALVLQIPFTILHLAGNVGFALTLSPILNKWLERKTATASQFSFSLK